MANRQKSTYFDSAKKLGERLRATREAAGLSQRALAGSSCTPAYVSRIEQGERAPSLQLLREFAERLGVTESQLAFGTTGTTRRSTSGLAEARVATRLGDLEAAKRYVDAALSDARSDSDRAKASAAYGEIELAAGRYREATDALERARKLDPNLEAADPSLAESLGRAYAHSFEYAAAIAVFTRARERADTSADKLNQVRFSALLAHANSDSGNFSAAEDALAVAVQISDELGDPLSKARALWGQSRVAALQSDADTAARYAEQALETLEVSDQDYYAALAHQLLAHIEIDRGNEARALDLLERAESRIMATGRIFERASFNIEKARALLGLDRAEEAAAIAMEASALMREESSVDAGRSFVVIADVFSSLGDTARASEMYELAIESLKATPNRYLVEAYSKLAELLEKNGHESRALALLKEAMNVQQQAERMLSSRP